MAWDQSQLNMIGFIVVIKMKKKCFQLNKNPN